ncbi:MAG TPA: hypothetical protein VGI03_04780 [Verrucomicrobiae bacterium]|jgi:endogenous inhibitor of DNA gyrase (YacG/DUF329 family)
MLYNCPSCGQKVSINAQTCPKCGEIDVGRKAEEFYRDVEIPILEAESKGLRAAYQKEDERKRQEIKLKQAAIKSGRKGFIVAGIGGFFYALHIMQEPPEKFKQLGVIGVTLVIVFWAAIFGFVGWVIGRALAYVGR